MTGWRPSLRSFRDKVTWMVTAISATAIAALAVALAAINHYELRNAAFDALHAQSRVAAMNSGAPLAFDDRAAAREVLAAFQAMPSIDAATLYGADGKVFARYRRPADADPDGGLLEALPAADPSLSPEERVRQALRAAA